MNTWKVILATLVIFGAGVLTGGLLVNYSDRTFRRAAESAPPPPAAPAPAADPARPAVMAEPGPAPRENRVAAALPAPLRKEFLGRLTRELALTPEQHDRVERIIADGQDRTREIWRLEWVEIRQKIRAQLTPDQQKHFEELLKPRGHEQHRPGAPREHVSTNAPAASFPQDQAQPAPATGQKL